MAKNSGYNNHMGNSYNPNEIYFSYKNKRVTDNFGKSYLFEEEKLKNILKNDLTSPLLIFVQKNVSHVLIYEKPETTLPSEVIFLKSSIDDFSDFSVLLDQINSTKIAVEFNRNAMNTLAFLAYWGVLDEFMGVFTKNAFILYINNRIVNIQSIPDYPKDLNVNAKDKYFPLILFKNKYTLFLRTPEKIFPQSFVFLNKQKLSYKTFLFFENQDENKQSVSIIKDFLGSKNYDFPVIDENYIDKWEDILLDTDPKISG